MTIVPINNYEGLTRAGLEDMRAFIEVGASKARVAIENEIRNRG